MTMQNDDLTPLREADITRSIAREFYKQFDQLIESDVIIVGGGPSGLICARDLATAGLKVLIIEQMTHLGGGFWSGGYQMTKASIAAPAHKILEEVEVPCQEVGPGHYLVEAPHACAKLIGAAFDAGAKVLNLTKVVDLILRNNGQLEGVVVNWWPAESMGHDIVHVDPIGLESKVVVDATGHDAVVLQLLAKRKLFKEIPGNGAMWVEKSEEMVLQNTGETYPQCFVIGLAVAAVYGTPRMGPAFGAMLLSGRKGAQLILERFKTKVK
jgi:sulfide-dependent adenosine diphosphate thiazole synthase